MDTAPMIEALRQEIRPAVGCTEPAAAAYATAVAVRELGKTPTAVRLLVSRNILKNAMGVGIPGTDMAGLEIAGALAAIAGDPDAVLEVLHNLSPETIAAAKAMVAAGQVQVALKDTEKKLYIEAIVSTADDTASAIITDDHTHIAAITHGSETRMTGAEGASGQAKTAVTPLTIAAIYEFMGCVKDEELTFLDACIQMNERIAREGLRHTYGLSLGRSLYEDQKLETPDADLEKYAVAMTCAAADARMGGSSLPVMSSCGSGNQGLTATMPLIAVARKLSLPETTLRRLLAMSLLTTIHVKRHMGKLSPLCACSVGASIGTACALTWWRGGTLHQVEDCIRNVIADVSGVICDGAKAGCSLKIATGVSSAFRCSMLALRDHAATGRDGIVCEDVEKTIDNLGQLGNTGMAQTDRVILDMLVCK